MVEYNSSSCLYEQLVQMQRTGVYVSVHTSNLANTPLLQPGSAVFEIIHVRGCREGWGILLTQHAAGSWEACNDGAVLPPSCTLTACPPCLQRNWHWHGLDTSFRDQTLTMCVSALFPHTL